MTVATIRAFVRTYWKPLSVAAAVAVLTVLLGISTARSRTLLAERDAARVTITQIKAASIEAGRAAIRQREAAEARYKELADNADREYDKALADAHSAAERYIASHGVRAARAAGPASGTVAATEGHPAQGGDRSGIDALMVAVTPEDVRICTVNSQRLESVRTWALGL